MYPTHELLDEVEEDLLSRAFLYEHAHSFREGVEASIEAVRALLSRARLAAIPAEGRRA